MLIVFGVKLYPFDRLLVAGHAPQIIIIQWALVVMDREGEPLWCERKKRPEFMGPNSTVD